MDSNKEEAERCARIAKALIEEGNVAKGRKFLLKASRLYPSPSVDELLSKLGEKDGESGVSSNGNSASPFKAARSSSRNENVDETSQSASEDQVEIVRKIKRTSDYYEILGLEKSCSEEDVKKAYRKLSLKVHPDKNKAPGAEEAFKLVSKAFQCLSNSELRLKYDQYGPEEARRLNDANGMRHRRHNDFFYEEVDPNEIFQNFFFGGQGFAAGFQRPHHVRTQHGGRHFGGQRAEVHSTNTLVIVQLLAVLVLFFLSYFPFSQPIYSLQGGGSYAYAKTTSNHGVSYYVNSANFDRDYPLRSRGRRQIEGQVEGDYKEILIHNCRTEMNLHYFGRIKEMPNCVKLEKFQRTY